MNSQVRLEARLLKDHWQGQISIQPWWNKASLLVISNSRDKFPYLIPLTWCRSLLQFLCHHHLRDPPNNCSCKDNLHWLHNVLMVLLVKAQRVWPPHHPHRIPHHCCNLERSHSSTHSSRRYNQRRQYHRVSRLSCFQWVRAAPPPLLLPLLLHHLHHRLCRHLLLPSLYERIP